MKIKPLLHSENFSQRSKVFPFTFVYFYDDSISIFGFYINNFYHLWWSRPSAPNFKLLLKSPLNLPYFLYKSNICRISYKSLESLARLPVSGQRWIPKKVRKLNRRYNTFRSNFNRKMSISDIKNFVINIEKEKSGAFGFFKSNNSILPEQVNVPA